jgi:ribosomal protein S18 acetylase RimI-like enzyme
MNIRSATAADVAGIALLVAQYWEFESIRGFEPARIERGLGALLREPQHGACWVADDGQALRGYLLAVYMFSLEHGGFMAEIDELYVTAQLRAVGVGSSLLAAAERDMAARGLVQIQLQLAIHNQRGRQFYERHGFRPRAGYAILDKRL